MAEIYRKPLIRFVGFNDVWEKTEFEKYGHISMNKRIFKYQTTEQGEIPFYKIGTFGGIPDAFISEELYNEYKNKYPYPQKGDILVSASGSIGKTVEFNGEKAYFQDSNIVWFDHAGNFNNKFLKQLYSIVKWSGLEGSTIKRLYNSNFLETEICIPKIDEQTLIGNLFEQIDDIITLYQRKYEKLINVKKSLLEKMFPDNGDEIPKIRFQGYADMWKEFKYGEIGSNYSGGSLSYDDLSQNGKYKCVLYGELYTRYNYIINNVVNRTNKQGLTILKNDILFPQSTTVDAYSLISPACFNEKNAETSGVFVIRPYENFNGNFVTYYTKGNPYQRLKLSKKAQGLTIVHLYYHSIKDEIIKIPVIEEQDKIADLFIKLDNLINLYQRKYEKLKNIKKALLEKMFV